MYVEGGFSVRVRTAFKEIFGIEDETIVLNVPDAKSHKATTSRYNEKTVWGCLQVVKKLVEEHGFEAKDIMVISPYSDDEQLLKRARTALGAKYQDLLVTTVDGAQGREKPIAVHSFPNTRDMGFTTDPHRMAVEYTRASHGQVLIINYDSIKGAFQYGDSSLSQLLDWHEENHLVVSNVDAPGDFHVDVDAEF